MRETKRIAEHARALAEHYGFLQAAKLAKLSPNTFRDAMNGTRRMHADTKDSILKVPLEETKRRRAS